MKNSSLFRETWIRIRQNKLAMVGLVLLCLLVLIAIFADVIAPYGYEEQHLSEAYQKPSSTYIFGTDEFGRDIFSRVIYGSRISLFVGFVAVSIAAVIGVLLGAIAGYYGSFTDNVIMRAMDIILAVPQILLAIAIVSAFGSSLINLMIATGISTAPNYARLMRASVLSLKEQEFIEAARAAGTSNFKIIFRHILPNSLSPILVQATFGVGLAIIAIAGLSFIGLGLQPPTPEWGAMLSTGRTFIRNYPYMTIFPGLAIAVTVFSLNVLGDGLRDALDPKLRD